VCAHSTIGAKKSKSHISNLKLQNKAENPMAAWTSTTTRDPTTDKGTNNNKEVAPPTSTTAAELGSM
jgi:hypothetical protein